MDITKYISEREQDLLAGIEDEQRAGKGIFEMDIKVNRISDMAEARGFRVEPVWTNGMVAFDLIRISDEVVVLEAVGTVDIERYVYENTVAIKLIESLSASVHTEHLGEHSVSLDSESGSLLIGNSEHQLVLSAQEAYMLLDFLYQHRDTLDEAMHRIVE